MTDEPQSSSPSAVRRSRIQRAFRRPLLVWTIASGWILLGDAYKRTTIQFEVAMDLGSPQGVSATVDGQPFFLGKRVEPGGRKLVISAVDADPVEREVFLWFGPHDLGEIRLHRSRGALEVNIAPEPNQVEIKGEFFSGSSTNSYARFSSVPVGTYQVTATFAYSTEERRVRVAPGKTAQLDLTAPVGSLALATRPSDAEYSLSCWAGRNLSLDGVTPATIHQLPAGQYALQVRRGDYQKKLRVDIKPGETNGLNVAFEYAELSVATDPAGAVIFLDGKEAGQTPRTITELRPGRYEVRLEREDYLPVAARVEIKGNESLVIATNLVSRKYVSGMESARRFFAARPPEIEKALASVEEALKAVPGDKEASELKNTLLAARGRFAEERQAAEMQARKRFAAETFKHATEASKDSKLFDTHVWQLTTTLQKARDALLRSLGRDPVSWELFGESTPNEENVIFYIRGKGFLAKQRHCTVLLTQFPPNEVQVTAKFWDYALGNKINLSLFQGISEDSYIPVHPSYYRTDERGAAEARRKAIADTFKTKLINELGL